MQRTLLGAFHPRMEIRRAKLHPQISLGIAGRCNEAVDDKQQRCCLVFIEDKKRGAAARFVDDTRRIGGLSLARRRSAMCCAQLDALQVEKRIGVSGARARIWRAEPLRSSASARARARAFSFLFQVPVGPSASPQRILPSLPFLFLHSRPR